MKQVKIPWWKEPMTLATVVIAVATVVSIIIAGIIGYLSYENIRITKETYNAAHRPYVGIKSVNISETSDKNHLIVTIKYSNSGSVPACNIKVTKNSLIDKFKANMVSIDKYDAASSLFPADTSEFDIKCGINNWYSGLGGALLEIDITISYYGIVNDKHSTYERWRYDDKRHYFSPVESRID